MQILKITFYDILVVGLCMLILWSEIYL